MKRPGRIRLFSAYFSILVLWGYNFALATTRYVSHSGSDTAPYDTWETATPRLAFAAQSAQPGDTIRMAAGEYSEPETVFLNGGITLIGAGADSTELKNNGLPTVQVRTESGNLTILNMGFSSEPADLLPIGIHYFAPDDTLKVSNCIFNNYEVPIGSIHSYIEVSDCEFIDCADHGDAINLGSGNGIVENNTFTNAHGHNSISIDFVLEKGRYVIARNIFSGYQTGVVVVWSLDLVTIENNLFVRNQFAPPQGGVSSSPYVFSGTPYLEVYNNLFDGNFVAESVGEKVVSLDVRSYGDARIYNNTFVGKQPAIRIRHNNSVPAAPPYVFQIDHNNFWTEPPYPQIIFSGTNFRPFDSIFCESYFAETDTSLSIIDNNLCRDPMFVDTVDYLLQLHSPCIDAGRPDVLDVDGTRSDIGPFGGPGGAFYAYQDLRPQMPQGLNLNETAQSTRLSWLGNSESDLSHYVIFRDTDSPPILDSQHVLTYVSLNGQLYGGSAATIGKRPLLGGLLPGINSHLIGNRQSLHYIDIVAESNDSFAYAVAAVDSSGLVSEPAVIGQGGGSNKHEQVGTPLPTDFDLEQNYPNPFNAVTAIVYNLPDIGAQPAVVELVIYNSLGRRVRTLVDQDQFPGRQVAYWDGKDATGKEVASGIYFYRLRISGIDFVKSRKMILVK